jgi:RNA polymerase sigma-70 factor (ECF subfamily)
MSEQLPSREDSENLVEAAQAGAPDSIGRLLDACRPYLLLIANQEMEVRGPSKVTASDIVQETFLEAYRDFADFTGQSEQNFRGWLRRILLHNLADAYRRYAQATKRQSAREADLSASAAYRALAAVAAQDPTPSHLASDRERNVRLEEALARLPDHYRAVIFLRYREGLSFDEIAQRTNRSVEAVRKLWLRGVKRLQQGLVGQEGNELL